MAAKWKKSTGKGTKPSIRVIDDAVHRVKEAKLELDIVSAAIKWQETVIGSPESESAVEHLFSKVIALKAWRVTKGPPKNLKIPKKAIKPHQDPEGHRGQRPNEAGFNDFPG